MASFLSCIAYLKSSKLGVIVTGMPRSSVKKVCVGNLQMLTHAPLHCTLSRYLHRSILTLLDHSSRAPLLRYHRYIVRVCVERYGWET